MSGCFDPLARLLLRCTGLLPRRHRLRLLQLFIEREEVLGDTKDALRFLLAAEDDVDRAVNRAAMRYGDGAHPKHRLTEYHQFFIRHIRSGERVLDVGCGGGEVAADVAAQIPGCFVTGIDCDGAQVRRARERHPRPNLRFIEGDALRDTPEERFDVVILSNVLEHIQDRIPLLQRLRQVTQAGRFLIRVPLFQRHWHVPLRKELGLPHFSDPTHVVEHSPEEIREELRAAGLRPVVEERLWGEIWLVAEPIQPAAERRP